MLGKLPLRLDSDGKKLKTQEPAPLSQKVLAKAHNPASIQLTLADKPDAVTLKALSSGSKLFGLA